MWLGCRRWGDTEGDEEIRREIRGYRGRYGDTEGDEGIRMEIRGWIRPENVLPNIPSSPVPSSYFLLEIVENPEWSQL
jgi:hypothetical protein